MIPYLLLALTALILLPCAAALFETLAERSARRRLPPPGRLIDVDGCLFHLHVQGRGTPTVVFEAGIAASSLSWSHVQPGIAAFTQVASYDRAGLGWSDTCRRPVTLAQMTSDLTQLLEIAAIPPPYILVGHSFGGLLIRAFAHQHPQAIAGLLFVDPVSMATWATCSDFNRARLVRGARLSRRGALLARLGIVRFALASVAAGRRAIPRSIAQISAGRATSVLQRLIGEVTKLPPEVLPAVRSHWSHAKSFHAMANHLECLPLAAEAASRMTIPRGIPITILSAETANDAELLERDSWVAESAWGCHTKVSGTGHWLHLEQPDTVVAAVKQLIEQYAADSIKGVDPPSERDDE